LKDEISIKEILEILRKRWLFLIIIPIIFALVVGIIVSFIPNQYTAEATLYVLMDYVDSIGQTRYDTSVSAQFAGDFKELIEKQAVINEAESRMNNTVDLEEDVDFDVSAVTNTRVINIKATSKSPTISLWSANTISTVFIEYITDLTKSNSITLASEAILPEEPSGPRRKLIIAISYAGMLFLLSALFVTIEVFNTTPKSADEVEAMLGVPVLSNIEDYRKELKDFFNNKGKSKVLADYVPAVTLESIKTLATNLEFSMAGKDFNSLMITSTESTEGKSSLAVLLAEALADDGYKVLIVDCDFRKPSIGIFLGIRHKYDLIDYIAENIPLEEVVAATHHEYVDFVDSCHKVATTSQVFNYKAFDEFFDKAKRKYHIVMFDTPPMGLFIDAAVLSAKVSATIMVVGKGIPDIRHVKETAAQLEKVHANLVGIAFNHTDRHRIKGNYYYYGQKKTRYESD
jgi:capsular exopolysaccharide synthesis family protein